MLILLAVAGAVFLASVTGFIVALCLAAASPSPRPPARELSVSRDPS
ncbi:MAG TPA: hypothetical protein VJB57_03105 [Dehalococcoidia bacterium]|nr:hypothetical protein [Dehalococcoidia bacterium]